jgi:hypothetical protein
VWQAGQAHLTPSVFFVWQLQTAAGLKPTEKPASPLGLKPRSLRRAVFCQQHQVGRLFIGNPHGVRRCNRGRHHNQRLAGWEYGRDIAYLSYKAKAASIESFTGSERGTSSQCPVCGGKQKVRGRVWRCRNVSCSFMGHRDVVGSVNMHPLAFGQTIAFPARITYQRAGPVRVQAREEQPCLVGDQQARSRRPDTGHSEDSVPFARVLSRSASRATT